MRRAGLALLLGAACGAAARPLGPPPVPEAPEAPATPEEVRAFVLETDRQLGFGYDTAFLERLVHDGRLLLIGVRAADLVTGEGAPRAARLHRLFGDAPVDFVSKDLRVTLARDASCAWIADDVSYRVLSERRRALLPLRQTALYERREGRWLLVLEHLSYPVADGEPAAASAPALVDATGDGPEGQAVRRRVLAVVTGADEGPVSLEEDALVIGPGAERARGRDVGRLATTPMLFPRGTTVEPTGLRVELSRSGTVAWAGASLAVHGATTFAARATFILEKRAGEWRVVQTHVSRPIDGRALAGGLGLPAQGD